MNISLAADHGALSLRASIAALLTQQGHHLIDHGPHNDTSVDYPDYATLVCQDILSQRAERGVLICTTGIGMSITANRFPGIRAALVHHEEESLMCRAHNDANILCLGQKYTTPHMAALFLRHFLATPFEGGRHARRVHKMECAHTSGKTC